jgi:heme-degrading monooxygenase HmoA
VVILEAAVLQVREGAEAAFEEAMVKAAPVIAGSLGYIAHELQRCIETKGRYLLLVRWETLEAHTVGFRQSSAFVEWRTLIGPFFEAPPTVEHYEGALRWPRI